MREELWSFPHAMRLRIMGAAGSAVRDEVVRILQAHLDDFDPDTQLSLQPSRKGNYVSVQARVVMESAEQVRAIYAALNASPEVKVVL